MTHGHIHIRRKPGMARANPQMTQRWTVNDACRETEV
jgi:hypothetical protein